jgi:predicted HD phosphohydrolase
MKKVGFTRMDAGTKADFDLLLAHELEEKRSLPQRVLELLRSLDHDETGYRVNRFEHSLQAATRAARDDANEETIVCALLHDVGDLLAPDNHGEFAAAMLAPHVSEENLWIVRHHGSFQGHHYFHHWGRDRNARDSLRDHPYYDAALRFCDRWDQVSFDPDYDTLPLGAFEPMVTRLFGAERPE